MKLRIKNTTLTLKIISWLQIGGGITGLLLMAYLMLKTGAINGGILLIVLTGIGLFWYSIYSGKRLLTDTEKRTALILSIINYAVQVIQWSISGYGIAYNSGIEATLGIEGMMIKFNFAIFFTTFKMFISSGDEFFIKINFIAILIIVVLIDIIKELKNKSEEQEIIEQPLQTEEANIEQSHQNIG
jgi:hypothetical protein